MNSFSIGFLTLDIIILIAIFCFFFFWSLKSGKKVVARTILAFYPATLIFTQVNLNEGSAFKIIIYLVVFVMTWILLKKNLTSRKVYTKSRKFLDGVLVSFGGLIILLTIYNFILPISSFYSLTFPFQDFLTNKIPLIFWYITPLVTLILTNRDDN